MPRGVSSSRRRAAASRPSSRASSPERWTWSGSSRAAAARCAPRLDLEWDDDVASGGHAPRRVRARCLRVAPRHRPPDLRRGLRHRDRARRDPGRPHPRHLLPDRRRREAHAGSAGARWSRRWPRWPRTRDVTTPQRHRDHRETQRGCGAVSGQGRHRHRRVEGHRRGLRPRLRRGGREGRLLRAGREVRPGPGARADVTRAGGSVVHPMRRVARRRGRASRRRDGRTATAGSTAW